MKRRFGMWMTIVCILVVGVSVTRMTRDFVVSQGVETAAIVSILDAGKAEAAEQAENPGALSGNVGESFKNILSNGNGGSAVSAASAADSIEAYSEQGAATEEIAASGDGKDSVPQMNQRMSGPGSEIQTDALAGAAAGTTDKDPGQAGVTASETSAADAPGAGKRESDGNHAAADGAAEAAEEIPQAKRVADKKSAESFSVSSEAAIQETVKSPLDPVVISEEDSEEEEASTERYNAEAFFERFKTAESNAKKLWENVSFDNSGAYSVAAEQERVLWDYELNLVYNTIRSLMTEDEAERLKILELEWIRDRDLYAEKAAAKSTKLNAQNQIPQNQNPEYTRALTGKTKERCYWLVSEYENLLNGENAAK